MAARAIQLLLKEILDGEKTYKKDLCDEAEKELVNIIQQSLTSSELKDICDDILKKIIPLVRYKKFGVVYGKAGQFLGRLQQHLPKPTVKDLPQSSVKTVFQSEYDDRRNTTDDRTSKSHLNNSHYSNDASVSVSENRSVAGGAQRQTVRQDAERVEDYDQREMTEDFRINRSKEAAWKLRENNPDIADLSDVNRPTKIAERFSELYDNEWTEAFEAMTNKKNKIQDENVIKFLLKTVERVYDISCKRAANVKTAMKMKYKSMSEADAYERCLKELKIQANANIGDIVKDFINHHQQLTLDESKIYITLTPGGKVSRFVNKCANICWWMAIQDPPVHMVPTTGRLDPGLYRGYTKSGTELDYFVWPALKLYSEGGILSKGVVQYK